MEGNNLTLSISPEKKKEAIRALKEIKFEKFSKEPKQKLDLLRNSYIQYFDLDSCCCQTKIKDEFNALDNVSLIEINLFKHIVKKIIHHKCGGSLQFTIFSKIPFVCCSKCEKEFSLSSCSFNDFECQNCFRSFGSDINEKSLILKYLLQKPSTDEDFSEVTYNYYHCNIFLNQKMSCKKCSSLLLLSNTFNLIICKTCLTCEENKEKIYQCKICSSQFKSSLKPYDEDENDVIQQIIKLNIKEKLKAKPSFMKGALFNDFCKCLLSYKDKFFHSSKDGCNGILYKGEVDDLITVVCSECNFSTFEKWFTWTCPKCNTLHDRDELAAKNIKQFAVVDTTLRRKRRALSTSVV